MTTRQSRGSEEVESQEQREWSVLQEETLWAGVQVEYGPFIWGGAFGLPENFGSGNSGF
jgi:hypothetical protein